MTFDFLGFLAGCWFAVRFDDISSQSPGRSRENDELLRRATRRLMARVIDGWAGATDPGTRLQRLIAAQRRQLTQEGYRL